MTNSIPRFWGRAHGYLDAAYKYSGVENIPDGVMDRLDAEASEADAAKSEAERNAELERRVRLPEQ